MRARLPWVLLAVSLAANVFFAAGVAYTIYAKRQVAESTEARVDLVADRLDLDEAQRESLALLRERAEVRRSAWRERSEPMRAALLDQVAAPNFDRERVLEQLEEWGAERRLYFAEFAEDLHGFLATLTPEQKARFLELAREPGFLREVSGKTKNPGEDR